MKKICRVCNKEFETKYKSLDCSKYCKSIYIEQKRIENLEKLRSDNVENNKINFPDSEPDNYIECKECGLRMRRIGYSHLKFHNLTIEEYKEKYNLYSLICVSLSKEKSKRVSGENNPAYQHGGRLSPFSKKFHKYSELSETEVQEQIDGVCNKSSLTKKEHPENDSTRIEYYLAQGYSEEESQIELTKRQKTFSLDICIEKHGKVEGLRIFQDRQDRWQATLNAKPQEEIDDINRRKGLDKNGIPHVGSFLNSTVFIKHPERALIPGILYYIRMYNNEIEFWKIGITTLEIHERFETPLIFEYKYKLNMEIISTYNDTIENCFNKEQHLLKLYNDNRITVDYNSFRSTECFDKDCISINEIT